MTTENQSCPSCGQEYTASGKSGLCKLCLEDAMEQELLDEDDKDDAEDLNVL